MQSDGLQPVPRARLKRHLLAALGRYWPERAGLVEQLPIQERFFPEVVGPLQLVDVTLPAWGASFGVDGVLVVPREACDDPTSPTWQTVDWWLAAFLLLECWHERAWENKHGVIHSYSTRLTGWDRRVWERAWVNRIALFLRSWAAFATGQDAAVLFGSLPSAELLITHDVDAVEKTWAIRLKQGAFFGFNATRLLAMGRFKAAGSLMAQGLRFLVGRDDWWMVGVMQELERQAGLRSQFNFYADDRPRTPKRWLFDPAYSISDPKLVAQLVDLALGGWRIGLHQTYDAWYSPQLMSRQRERLQSFVPQVVNSCRQHWLRFSWADTWAAQSAAGFTQDTTLMFNDRPGFRAGGALSWVPWDATAGNAHALHALPTVLMDSHFYDYQPMSAGERQAAIRNWLEEIFAVGGEAAVLWHPHTITADYGWREGFQELLTCIENKAACSSS
jgi:hypothetical protein